jgi:hypothetical protein
VWVVQLELQLPWWPWYLAGWTRGDFGIWVTTFIFDRSITLSCHLLIVIIHLQNKSHSNDHLMSHPSSSIIINPFVNSVFEKAEEKDPADEFRP